MKKKLSLLMVALVALAAFAVQVGRRAVTELAVVSEATVWDFSTDVTLSDAVTTELKYEGDEANVEHIYANIEELTFAPTFNAEALAFKGQYPFRSNSKKFAQAGTLHFKTSVPGKIVVKFSDTGSSASATAVKRYLVVNGEQTEYWASRENNGTEPYAAQLNVTSGEIAVPEGDVTITGSSAIVMSYVAFTPDATTPETPDPELQTGDPVVLDFTVNDWGFPTDAKAIDEAEFTNGTYTVKVAGTAGNGYRWYPNNGNPYFLFGKQGAYITLPAFDFDVAKIEIVGTSVASTSVKQNIFVGEEAVSTETTGAKDVTNVYEIAEAYQAAGNVYSIKVTSNHNSQLQKILVYPKGGASVPATDIEVSSADGDIAAALAAAQEGIAKVGNITINLTKDVTYTVSAPIVAPASVTINGNGATVDASALEGNFIQMAVVESPTEWTEANVTVKGITVKGLKKALFYSACKNYFGDVTVDNCVVEQAADVVTFDYTKGSTAVNFTVTNSTFYAPTATTKSLYSSQGGQKTTEYKEDATQTFTFTNNTMYNLAPGKNFFTHRQANQKWLAYVVKNNIFVNCGKSGQVIKGMNGGQSGTNPTWAVDGNIFNFETEGVMTDTSAAEDTGDTTEGEGVQNSVAGVVAFTDAAAGNFNGTIALGEGVAAPATMPGDPRWKVKVPAEDIEISPASGDIAAALATAAEGKNVGNITINLTKDVTYTVSAPIVAPASVTINGYGATVDASALEGNFIQMAVVESPAEWTEANVSVKDITVKGLKKALFYSACKNYFGDVIVDNCVVEQAADAVTFDYTKGSTAVNFVVTSSTFYAPTATTKSFYSSQGGQKTTEYKEDATQTFTFINNTMYNLAPGKNFFSHRQSNQKWLIYVVKNNIFVNCGKSGQVIKGMNGGQSGTNPTWDIDGNVFNFDGADTSAAEDTGDADEPVKNSIAGVVAFTDAATGDFNAQLGVATVPTAESVAVGDPRWKVIPVQVPVDIVVAPAEGDIAAALAAEAEGKLVKNITINLTKDVTYTVSEALVAPYSITINGNGATIDASALTGNLIQMAVVESPAEWTEANVTVKGITVKGLKKALFYSACKNYFGDVTVDNCVVEQAADAVTFDYTKGSTAVNFAVTNSTFYAPTATTKSFYSSQSGQKTTEYKEDATQTFTFTNNTMYNLAPGKNFFTHRQANQKWLAYVVKNNIFVNCGKSGQVIKGMNGGQGGTNPTWAIDGNIFNFETEGVMTDTSAAEDTGDTTEGEGVQNSVAGVVTFTDAAAGDFNAAVELAEGATIPTWQIGDSRWTITFQEAVAGPEKFYIMGQGTTNEWAGTTEMTFNADTKAFEYTLDVAEKIYFTFGDAEFTGWDDFNANHRYAYAAGDQTAVLDEAVQLVKVNGTLVLDAGKYLVSVKKDLKCTITKLGEATGISTVKADGLENVVIYNLRGQRVENATKGLYIVNGKKVVLK